MIEIKHLKKSFESITPLNDVNCTINSGDVISIIGPSGTGKSTLLRCINMLDVPTSGEILVDGEDIAAKDYDVTKARKKIGMVFQSFNLFNNLSVIENIMKPQIDLLHIDNQKAYEKGMELLKKVGLANKKFAYPCDLSGGQKQRVAICRTLAMEPEIILFDEPTSALDPTMVDEVKMVIADLAKEGKTMMIVTHEMEFARTISNRIFYMDEGVVYEEGSPDEIFENPKKEKTKQFVKQLRVLNLNLENKNFDFNSIVYKINDYCYKNQLDKKTSNDINLVFEELCKQIIAENMKNEDKIFVELAYSKKTKDISMKVRYTGNKFNPLETNNELSLKLIKEYTKQISYDYIDNEYSNDINIKF